MFGLKPVAGSAIYIGSTAAYKSRVEPADFAGQSWLRVKGATTYGDLGAEQEVLQQRIIDENVTIYGKGGVSFPTMANAFTPDMNDPGQAAFAAAQRSCEPYHFRIVWGSDCEVSSAVTISVATPGVVSWVAHGFSASTPISFTTTGTLPTGLTVGTVYYVVDPTTDAFSVSATPGGAAIDTTGAGTGVHTGIAMPVGETDMFLGFALYGTKTAGDASANRGINMPIQPISFAITV